MPLRSTKRPRPIERGRQRGFATLIGLILALILGMLMIWNASQHETIPATIVDSRFVQERGPDGHTRITLQADDGRRFSARRPGRHLWQAGEAVQVVVSGKRVIRIQRPAGE